MTTIRFKDGTEIELGAYTEIKGTFYTVKWVGPDTMNRKYHLFYDTYRVGGPQQYQTYKKVS